MQILSETELLVSDRRHDTFYVSGLPTAKLIDGSYIGRDQPFVVVGKKRYQSVTGTRTVIELRPIPRHIRQAGIAKYKQSKP